MEADKGVRDGVIKILQSDNKITEAQWAMIIVYLDMRQKRETKNQGGIIVITPSKIFGLPLVECPKCHKLVSRAFLFKFGCTYCDRKRTYLKWAKWGVAQGIAKVGK